MDIIQLKDRPDIAAIVALVSKKKKAILARPTNSVSLSGTYWDEGSRSSYFLINVSLKQVVPLPHYSPPQFGGRQDVTQLLEPGYAVIDAGVFCGKPATPVVYLPFQE